MLYERWLETVDRQRSKLALMEFGTGQSWTFEALQTECEQCVREGVQEGSLASATGGGLEFVLGVLRGWRLGIPVCPLERGQAAPLGMLAPKGTAHVKSTSATTSSARWVCFTEAQLAADVDALVPAMGLRGDAPNLAVISMAHSYGFSNLVMPLLLHGVPLVTGVERLPGALARASACFEAVTLPAVPALWSAWHTAGAIPGNARVAISAGAPLPLPLDEDVFRQYGLKIHNFYGSTECGGIAYDDSQRPREDPWVVGRALPGRTLSMGEAGNLVVEGASVGLGYWPEAPSAMGMGRFETSDAVRLEQGIVRWLGRLNDTINVAGRKLHPEVVERVLAGCPDVREVAVFGVTSLHASRGDEVVACWAGGEGSDELRIKDHATRQLEDWQVPRHWVRVGRLPVNERGKISRSELRARWQRGESLED
ncbi:MAG: long-chain fatty acid--CoA ligase [Verrucomicrobia bacterium]|nr:long-chain fatty acid--CoA ligase [Verrucomicrobiota bacterium]